MFTNVCSAYLKRIILVVLIGLIVVPVASAAAAGDSALTKAGGFLQRRTDQTSALAAKAANAADSAVQRSGILYTQVSTSTAIIPPSPPPPLAVPVPGSIELGATVDPDNIVAGQEAQVTITLSGQELAQCFGGLGQAVDAVFVFDISDSAGNGAPGSNWYQTVQFTQSLFQSLAQPIYDSVTAAPRQSALAMISSRSGVAGPEPAVLLDLTIDYSQASQILTGVTPGGDSNIADGTRKAQELLAESDPAQPNIIFLMLHDNVPLSTAAMAAAQEVREAGTQVYLISNDLNITEENQIPADMAAQVTGGASQFLPNPTPEDLRLILVQASGGDADAAARKLLIRSDFTPRAVMDIVNVLDGGVIRSGEAVWEVGRVSPNEQLPLRYTVRARADAPPGGLQLLLGAAYLDCNGYVQGQAIAQGAPLTPALGDLNVTPPTPTPTPTPTGTPPPTVVVPTTTSVPTTAPGATAVPAPLIPSQVIAQNLCPGDARVLPLQVTIPAVPARADVLLAFDVSSSMMSVLSSAALNASQLVDGLNSLIPDVQIGVVIFSDYPVDPYGAPGDTAYEMLSPITSDFAAVRQTLNTLPALLQDGGDGPEAYTRVLYEAAENPALGWRPDARHFVIFFGDSIPHQVDPGRDGIPGTVDDLQLDDVLEEVQEEELTPLFAASDLLTQVYWQDLLEPIGGEAVLMEDASTLPATILDLITRSGARIGRLAIEAAPGYASWIQVNPSALTDVAAGAGPNTFDVTLLVPPDTFAGDYTVDLAAVGDGAAYERWRLDVAVPATCAQAPPPPPTPPSPFPCDSWLWLYLLPLLLPLLLFGLWWLVNRYLNSRRRRPRPNTWRCRLPCLLALLLLLLLGFVLGQRLARTVCIAANSGGSAPVVSVAGTSGAATPGAVGSTGSQRVAAIVSSGAFALSSERPDVTFERISLDDLSAATLANYDTLVLSQVCNIAQQPQSRLQEIVAWVKAGHKLIIYDSDECSAAVDYSWLPYPFTTDNPGARGSTRGQLEIVANDSMVSADPAMPSYIDPAGFAGIEVGDANVMVTQDLRWCGNMEAVNDNAVRGFVHTYGLLGNGLIIYNGLDTDNINTPAVYQLWQQELDQPWDSVNGRSLGLPCQRRVAGDVALFGPINLFGLAVPFWLPLLLLALLWLLCYLGCRTFVEAKGGGLTVATPPVRSYVPPQEPVGGWDGPPPVWNPEKTLIIGLGGAGRGVLTLIKKNLLDAGAGDISSNVRLLLVDNSATEQVGQEEIDVSFAGVRLASDEMLALGQDFNELIRDMARGQADEADMARWFPAAHYAERKEIELDLRKGTGGQRPLGRAVVFNDLHKGDASRLWAALLQGVGAAQEGEQARVVIVGSLAGGFGSAVLADVAYLVRHAARKVGARFASIEAYLACQHTFDGVVSLTVQRELSANTAAALKELRRFQLQGESFPYPMVYNSRFPDDPVWSGKMDRPLLDDLYLFDGYRPQRPLLREQPLNGVYATIADAVTLHLDPSSRSGTKSLWAYRRQAQGQSTSEQQQTGQAVVSGLGAFAYRLPVFDLAEALKVRWAKHILGALVIGEAGGELRLDPSLNKEDPANRVTLHAQQFIQGLSGLGKAPVAVTLLGQVLDRDRFVPTEWASQVDGVSLGDLDAEERRYRSYLVDALTRLLNGSAEDPMVARTGKLGYAVRWLETIERAWGDVGPELQLLPGRLGKRAPANLAQWAQVPARYRQATAAVRSSLLDLCGILARELAFEESTGGWRDVQRSPQAIYERLLAREEQLAGYRREMAAVITRRYFMDDKLLDQWYEQYLAAQVPAHIDRLFWQPTAGDEDVDLVFSGLATQTRLRSDGPAALAAALIDMAGFLAKDIWSQETLATYLASADLQPQRIPATADEMWAASAPLLDYDPGAAPNVQALAVLGVNRTVRDADLLADKLAIKLPSQQQMRQLEITDPYTMLLARLIDVIPAGATTPQRDADRVFLPMYGLTRETANRGISGPPRLVFPAEQHAMRYEQRLPELNQAPRVFHPLVAAALEDEERAILFAKALASDLIRTHYDRDHEILVVDSARGPYQLTKPSDNTFGRLSPLLIAMLRFTSAPQQVMAGVQQAVDAIPDAPTRWRDFIRQALPVLAQSEREGVKDMAAFIELVLYDSIDRRRNKAEI